MERAQRTPSAVIEAVLTSDRGRSFVSIRTNSRQCGNQPAHQCLITDVFQPCLLPCASICCMVTAVAVFRAAYTLDNGHQSIR